MSPILSWTIDVYWYIYIFFKQRLSIQPDNHQSLSQGINISLLLLDIKSKWDWRTKFIRGDSGFIFFFKKRSASFYVHSTFRKMFSGALFLRVLTFVIVRWSASATQKNTVRKTGTAASKLQAIDLSSPLDIYKHRSFKAEKTFIRCRAPTF